jgi:DnaJ like chaperone protein
MSVWSAIIDLVGSVTERTGVAGTLANALDPDNWLPGGRDAAFTLALVALSAKMAVADGVVTNSEVRAFRSTVEISSEDAAQVDRLFALAQEDMAGYRSYARRIGRLFADAPETLEHVLDGLFVIATADGLIHEDELAYLHDVSQIFGFDEARFEQILAQHAVTYEGTDPFVVLGLEPSASNEEVRRVYLRLVQEHHPDRLHAKGVPDELMSLATTKMASINHAYQTIAKTRGI